MATMTYRTTFALDKDTRRRLKRLSDQWQVSQAEVVRRALSQAENQHQPEKPNPIEALHSLHASGRGIARKTAAKYLTEVRANRDHWRGE
jgi:predicted transcriptional regulator